MGNIKIAIVVRDDLAAWQALNVTAFLASGLAAELTGQPYEDADGTKYQAMFAQPVLVFQADAATLKTAHAQALGRGLVPAIYTEELFTTGNDDDNRAAVRAVRRENLNLVGLALHGPKNAMDKILKGIHLYGTA